MGKRGTPRASCDPCRRKKVKCDKEQCNAEGISLCTFCCARGYDCIITDDARPNTDKAEDSVASATSAADGSSASKKRKSSDANSNGATQDSNGSKHGRSQADSVFATGINVGSSHDPFAVPDSASGPDMLNVRGLTRQILDDAVAAHFCTTYWCNPAVHPRHFYPRYRRYFSKLDGVAASSTNYDAFPPADILILAVACVGVVQLTEDSQRFDLQTRIFRRVEKLVTQACTKDLTVALDVLEAILLTLDVPARTKCVDEATRSSLDAGFVHPMSHTKMIRLLIHHGLNRSKDDPVVKAQRQKYRNPELHTVCEVNDERMPVILAVAAVNDIIRSFDMFDRHQLLQEDIDPDAMNADLGGPIGNQWAWQLSVMASVLRSNNLTFCAARSRRLGIPPSAILEVLDQLERFERQIPEALHWNTAAPETNTSNIRQLIHHDNSSEDIISVLVRKGFLNLLLWSQYRCIHTLVQANGLQRPAPGTRLDGSVYLRARQRVDSLLLTAVDRMSEICPQLASITVPKQGSSSEPPSFASVNLLDFSSIAFRSSTKGGAYYTLEMAKLTFKAGLHQLTADLLSKAGKKIYAFRTYQCHPDTQAEATRMRNVLLSLYSEFEMIPGLGATNESKLNEERERFSSVFEPAAAYQNADANAALLSGVGEMQWNTAGPTVPMGTIAPWSTPGADGMSDFSGSMTDFLAGLPFVNAGSGPLSTSPHPASYAPKTPASTAGAGASPFDLNAFLDTQIEPNSIPNARPAPSSF
ncbi:hypothetical protein NDA10_000551 [Ustilago hordei]|uniref:Zn(2)-C6 fungal-type domain-containing protein n=1 Tax=Ustilago hordei TaxID=120017 RepID=I2G2C3_USTHO|nr:uncharacterized protein UHO2_02522 [Ustilago hordei]KAJ1040195.1 hypothetical protein NDA10_000551 [Ustilago hordei]CCF53316.1 uncharacterized protein UHOR_02782 [Ustilago hordei]SYW78459.1 uncharacterized protein UHO2_02522 [Ustilago hordei]